MGLDLQRIEIAPEGIPWKFLLCLSFLVVLPCSLVYSAVVSHGFLFYTVAEEGSPYVAVACRYSIVVGRVLAALFLGFLSDLFGRKRILLVAIGFSAVYVPLFIAAGWVWNALQSAWGSYVMLLVVPSYLPLGILDSVFAVAMASALDVSGKHTQLLAALLVGIFGLGFISSSLHELADFLFAVTLDASLGFTIPLAVTAFFVLAFAWVVVWKILPETLNAPVPHVAGGEDTDLLGMGGDVQDAEVDPFAGAGRVKGSARDNVVALVRNLSYSHVWVAFWVLAGFMVVKLGLGPTSVLMLIVFSDNVGNEHDYFFPWLRGMELLVVEVAVLSVIAWIAVKAPAKVIRFRYYRIVLICSVCLLLVAIWDTLTSMINALIQREGLYVIARLSFVVTQQVLLPAVFLAKVCLLILITNCGDRNEGGVFVGLFTAGRVGVSSVCFFTVQILLFIFDYEFWVYPLAFATFSAVAAAVVCLVFAAIRFNLAVNEPQTQAMQEWGEPKRAHQIAWWTLAAIWIAISFTLWLSLWIAAVFYQGDA